MMYEGYGNRYNVWGVLFMLFMMALVAIGVLAAVRYLSRSSTTTGKPEETVIDVLKKRYANGEIDKKEYEEKKKDLSA